MYLESHGTTVGSAELWKWEMHSKCALPQGVGRCVLLRDSNEDDYKRLQHHLS